MKINTITIGKRFFAMTLPAVACLFLSPSVKADQVTWILDSNTGLDVQVVGTISNGTEKKISYKSPSGLWRADYDFSVGSFGYDSHGNTLYLVNSSGGRETYWNGRFFLQAQWGKLSTLPMVGGEDFHPHAFGGVPHSIWSAYSRIYVSADPEDPSRMRYTIIFVADGPDLPDFVRGAQDAAK